jgi:hypothetical protein
VEGSSSGVFQSTNRFSASAPSNGATHAADSTALVQIPSVDDRCGRKASIPPAAAAVERNSLIGAASFPYDDSPADG